MRRRWIVLTLMLMALTVAGPPPAWAHASLTSTSPANGSVVDAAPGEIVLTFSEDVDVLSDGIRLLAADATPVPLGPVRHGQDGRTLVVAVGDLADGTYAVSWRTVSADSHAISGAFSFSVGIPSETAPGLVERLDRPATRPGVTTGLAIGRWTSFAGFAVLVGTLTLAGIGLVGFEGRRAQRLVRWASVVALVGVLVMIASQASGIGRGAWSPSSWRVVLKGSAGRWWFARIPALCAGLVAATAARQAQQWWWRTAALIVAAATSVIFALGGHGMTGRYQAVGVAATSVHLAAMAVWVGGLIFILAARRGSGSLQIAARFSPVALSAASALVVSGLVNSWRQIGTLSGITDTTYGRWLVVKLTVVVLVFTLAATSRRLVRLSAASVDRVAVPTNVGAAANDELVVDSTAIRRAVLAELACVALILSATIGLVNAVPPRAQAAAAATVETQLGDWDLRFELDPAVVGGTTLRAQVTNVVDPTITPDEVTVAATFPSQGLGPLDIAASQIAAGSVLSDDANLPLAGLWRFTVTARVGDFDQVVFNIDVSIV